MPHQVVYVRGTQGAEERREERGDECYLLFWFSDSEMSPSGDGDSAITCIASSTCDAQVIVITESAVDDII